MELIQNAAQFIANMIFFGIIDFVVIGGIAIVFAKITEDCVRSGDRVLILAHRGELLSQAADKIMKTTRLGCATEKAEETCIGSWFRITVGSVQTMMREKRLSRFPNDYFDTIIIDEAHHSISDSYQNVLNHFDKAKVYEDTVLVKFPLYCPKCKKEIRIDVVKLKMVLIK